jgi:hypothetical protein
MSTPTSELPGISAPSNAPDRPAGLLRMAIGVVLGLVVGVTAVHYAAWHWLPGPELPQIAKALAVLEQERSEAAIAFIGTSHVLRGIDPVAFDDELARRDVHAVSVNLGVEGLRVPGQRYMLERIQEMKPPALRYVAIEPTWDLDVPARNRDSERVLALYDVDTTRLALRQALSHRAALADAMEVLRAAAYRALSIGRLAHALMPAAVSLRVAERDAPPFTLLRNVAGRRGYLPKRSLREGRNAKRFERQTDHLRRAHVQPFGRHRVDGVAMVLQQIRALGAHPVVVIPPNNRAEFRRYALSHRRYFRRVPLLDFNDPGRYPELYRAELYQDDGGHLNRVGARLFSELLARRFAREVLGRMPRA